ncbi:type VI secretion system amidase effector protein Tae4 [Pinibacter aurantiacus]|uniref:Type VI secretion system amidase effector protein Tae4 n=1 Tax=Pinibacter aurantiacus TaxID=2851599 RepID=A0A9E2S7X5_9BACT|nr:type VI secretion system amidase effector protein Tae4 [Pinibacter aurantiacus]MBV4356354.1 type VI secretion system amidase effector protein Tae4 [Pinibacter aurantiacus]
MNNRIFGDTSFVVTDKRIYNTNEDTTYFIIRTPGKADRQVQGTTTYWVTQCVQMMNVGNQGQLVGAPPGSTGDYYYENGYYCYSVPVVVNTPNEGDNKVYINMNKNYIIKFNRSDRNDGYLNVSPPSRNVTQPPSNNSTPPVTPGSRPTRDAGSRYFEANPDLVDDEDKSWWDDKTTTFPPQALPKWSDMDAAYPKDANGNDLPGPLVYGVVGGTVLNLYNSNPKKFANACALRVSMALNYSGVNIPNIPDHTFKGADNKYYFLSAAKLYNWMIKTFGTSNAIITTRSLRGTTDFKTPILGKKGIYIMQANSIPLFGATGHASLWNGSTCVSDHCYFDASGGIAKLGFWELK